MMSEFTSGYYQGLFHWRFAFAKRFSEDGQK